MTELSASRSSHTSAAIEGGAIPLGQPSMKNRKCWLQLGKKNHLQDSAQLEPEQRTTSQAMTANADPERTLEPCLQRVMTSTLWW